MQPLARTTATIATILLLVTAGASTAVADPAQPPDPLSSLDDASATEHLVLDAVPLAQSPVTEVNTDTGELALGVGQDELRVTLPVEQVDPTVDDLRYSFTGSDPTSDGTFDVTVGPTTEGAQIIVTIDSAASPTDYLFEFSAPDGFTPALSDDGSIAFVDDGGLVAGSIESPWAFDASGAAVPTHFVITGQTITQVVDHRGAGVAYPVTADPSVKRCDWRTALCLKLTRSETRSVHDAMFVSVAAGVNAICSKIPWGAFTPVRLGCSAAVAGYFYAMRGTFASAKRNGRCVEIKFNFVPPAYGLIRQWKSVGC